MILLKLERLGFIRRACELNRPKSRQGQVSWIYILSIADSQAAIDAQLRYNEIIKKEQRENRELRKERRRLAAEEIRRRAEARDLLRDTQVQTLVTQFQEQFEIMQKPISLMEIEQKVKSVDPEGDFMEFAIKLEKNGILTGYYVEGELDPTVLPPEIRRFREMKKGGQ